MFRIFEIKGIRKRLTRKKVLLLSVVFVILMVVISTSSSGLIWLILLHDFLKAVLEFQLEIQYRLLVGKIFSDLMSFGPMMNFIDDLPKLILMNPDVMVLDKGAFVGNLPIENMVKFMILLVTPFYILGIVATAFYLMFLSGSPMGRARAKSGLLKLVLSIPVIFLTIPIVQLLLDISEWLTVSILSVVDVTPAILMLKATISYLQATFMSWIAFSYWPSFRHPANALMFGMPVFLIIFMRYFIIILHTIMFPLTIFLYAFRFTSRLGAALFKQLIWWIFSQVMIAVILVGIAVAANSLPLPDDPLFRGCFGAGGFLALATAPLITMAIVSWGKMIGMMRDLMYTPWISAATWTFGLGIESIGKEKVSPPSPIEMPKRPPKS